MNLVPLSKRGSGCVAAHNSLLLRAGDYDIMGSFSDEGVANRVQARSAGLFAECM